MDSSEKLWLLAHYAAFFNIPHEHPACRFICTPLNQLSEEDSHELLEAYREIAGETASA